MPPKYEATAKERIRKALQKYTALLREKSLQGINEEDTSLIVHRMLVELFGYEEFREITGQHKVKGHFVDWAVYVDQDLKFFVEVKPLGARLRDKDLFQVVAYALQGRGVGWAVLTTGDVWQCYRVAAGSEPEQFAEVKLLDTAEPPGSKIDTLYLLTRESVSRNLLQKEWEQAECYRPERLARILLSDDVLTVIRRSVKRESPGRRVDTDGLRDALARGVIRGDVYAAIGQGKTGISAAKRKLPPPRGPDTAPSTKDGSLLMP